MATSDAGIALVILGKTRMIAMVSATNPAMMNKGEPDIQWVWSLMTVLNCSNWDMKIITAKK